MAAVELKAIVSDSDYNGHKRMIGRINATYPKQLESVTIYLILTKGVRIQKQEQFFYFTVVSLDNEIYDLAFGKPKSANAIRSGPRHGECFGHIKYARIFEAVNLLI